MDRHSFPLPPFLTSPPSLPPSLRHEFTEHLLCASCYSRHRRQISGLDRGLQLTFTTTQSRFGQLLSLTPFYR